MIDDIRDLKLVLRRSLAAAGIILVTACTATSPVSTFYELRAVPPEPTAGEQAALSAAVVGIGPIELAEILDRPQLVEAGAGSELRIAEYQRWGGSLRDNLGRVIATNLSRRIHSDQVFALTWSIGVDLDYRVALNIYRFDGKPGGDARLEADWIILDGNGRPLTPIDKVMLKAETQGPGYPAVVEALERLAASLSDLVAERLRELNAGSASASGTP